VRTLNVNMPEQERAFYPLVFGHDIGSEVSQWLAERGPWSRIALISDAEVAAIHGARWADILEAAGPAVTRISFPAGEGAKTRGTKDLIEDQMLAAGLGRDALVVALGGGVTLDLAGFVAATYMRSLPWIALPTTTLAMVDSSIGGKTGVDTEAGKNLIGAFHPPQAVFADIQHLETLTQEAYLDGFAEAIKHGLIASQDHFVALEDQSDSILARDPHALESILADSAAIKVRFVEEDEHEADARKALNYGHTFAHALERLSGWQVPHGQAVARGLIAEGRLSRSFGLFSAPEEERLKNLLVRYGFSPEPFDGLPEELRPEPHGSLTAEAYLAATRMDKKVRAGKVEYVLLARIGEVARGGVEQGAWARPVDDEIVRSALLTPAGLS
jgi:3-dehydroquinate synthase